jgi:hypothetical protein
MTQLVRGYYIRVDRGNWQTELRHGWGIGDELPHEWNEVKADPAVEAAQVFSSTQRNRRADKRKILDTYSREALQEETEDE